MLVKFTEKNKEVEEEKTDLTEEDIQKIIEIQLEERGKEKWTPSQEDLDKLEVILKNSYPIKSAVKEEPYRPSEEDLITLEKVFNNIIQKKEDEEFEKEEVIVEEHLPEIEEVQSNIIPTTQEVEKKNNELSESGEVYKVLNYKKRDA